MGAVFLYNWVFNNARGSVWIAILMHAASNAASTLLVEVIPEGASFLAQFQALTPDRLNVILFGLTAILLVIFTRGRLGYHPEDRPAAHAASPPTMR